MAKKTLWVVGTLWLVIIMVALLLTYRGLTQYRDHAVTSTLQTTPRGSLGLTSSAFAHGGVIPAKYTCDEGQTSPPLTISGVPNGSKSFALVMEDRDIPKNLKADGTFLHWVVYDIAPQTREIAEDQVIGTQGVNGLGTQGYMGPCPPPQYEPAEHRYYFTLYALDRELGLIPGANKDEILLAMDEHIIAEAELMGRYKRREK